MSVLFRIADQILKVEDPRDITEAIVHKYDAFLNLLCADRYEYQRDAVRETLRFLVSDKYPNLEMLARENWHIRDTIRQRHEDLDAYLSKMQLRNKKSVSLDLATGTGKSYVMYGLAAIALAEGLANRVLVLCPSVTIEDGLLEKFRMLAGNAELAAILEELDAKVSIPGVKLGNDTIKSGDICVENIHAAYANTGSSLRDSFRGFGCETLVLNDEAHHLFSPVDQGLRKWMEFLQDKDFDFCQIVNVTGTPYIAGRESDDYFPDVIFRYGLKQAISDKVVKKPNYKLEETYAAHDWQKTYAIHEHNRQLYGNEVKPITIVVTQEIARCVEVWRELVAFLMYKEHISREDAEKKAIWVTSSVPSGGSGKLRIDAVFVSRFDNDSPEKQRSSNLSLLKQVDDSRNPVEWIVSVSMLTEGWDVKNVFQIVPHESRAFSSKLLISQVLGRGLRIPPRLAEQQPLVTINNHEAWSDKIGNLLKEVLEVENTLTWGYDSRRSNYVFKLHNLRYEPIQTTVETKQKKAQGPNVTFLPQERKTTESARFSVSGRLAIEIDHRDLYEIEDAVQLLRIFLRGKNSQISDAWPKKKIRQLIVTGLKDGGYDETFLSKENLIRLQQSFGPMFRELDTEHPRLSQMPKELVSVDLTSIPRQVFSESALKEHGFLWVEKGDSAPFTGQDAFLWQQYEEFCKVTAAFPASASDEAKAIASRIDVVDSSRFKIPWNALYCTHEPERLFSSLLFEYADLFDGLVKMPSVGGYSFPYSYKPASAAKTHVANEHFNPDFFLKLKGQPAILVVEIKAEGDDSNRNRAKCRDGLIHFEKLNEFLEDLGEEFRYHFYFLTPTDFSRFFDQVRNNSFVGWRSGLMQELKA